jgi:hypothetical protein
MNVVAAAGFAAITLSCAPRDSTPALPVEEGAVSRLCYQCRQTKSEILRCSPDIEEACAELFSDVKSAGRRLRLSDAGPFPDCFDSDGHLIERDASDDLGASCTVTP